MYIHSYWKQWNYCIFEKKKRIQNTVQNINLTPIPNELFFIHLNSYFLWKLPKKILSIGPIIHEFDPYFNYRATEYLYHNGWSRFVTWFDYKVWYPLGRPVGTTIYPGMQVTAVFIKNHILPKMSLNDICVYIPAWFGSIASVMTGMLGYECSLPLSDCTGNEEGGGGEGYAPYGSILETIPIVSWIYKHVFLKLTMYLLKGMKVVFGSDLGLSTTSSLPSITQQKPEIKSKKQRMIDMSSPAVEIGLIAAGIMAIVPAHMMRSVGGGYDNESIANTAMTMTFYFWCRALRGSVEYKSLMTVVWALCTAISYFYVSLSLFLCFSVSIYDCQRGCVVSFGKRDDACIFNFC